MTKDRGITRHRTPFEWVILVASSLAVLTLAGGLLIFGILGPTGPANLQVAVDGAPRETSGGRTYELTITNQGGTSAEQVTIEATLGDVTREVSVELVAKGDTEYAEVVFPVTAPDATPSPAVVGYENP